MVIAQVVESDAPGGTERLVIQIAQDLGRRGHRVVVIGPAEGPGNGWLGEQIRALGFAWETVPRRWMLDPRAVLDLMRVLRRHRVEAVHSHEFAPSVFGAAASWLLRLPHVITMHSNLYFAQARRRRMAMRWAATHSTGVVAVSRDTRADIERFLGVPEGDVQVVINGIAARPGRRDQLRRELGLDERDLLVVALGNVSPRKAHILLLRALIQLGVRRPDLRWHLAIAGTDQGSAAELRDAAAQHGIAHRLHLLGHRPDTEDVLAASDLFAMSSLHEGMPLAIIEAMFARRAIVSSAAGGISEMIVDGMEGILTPVGNVEAMSAGLERLLSDSALRERMAAAAYLRAEREFGIAPMMDAYLRLYQHAA
ncbi:MAG TPA: glycosyltransferase family 4 protein [Gemmatimonadaceae bacterium]|nr:glycosyltransferase family 4 protein [Gemmatimonadaceae bacterium]